MASLRDNLKARLEAIGLELAQLDATKVGGVANLASRSGGTAVDHYKYKMSLYEEMAKINELLKTMGELEDAMANDDGPVEEITYGHI